MRTSFGRPLLRALPPPRSKSRARAQDGFMLIEVLISAVLVALITVATFTGFQAATRSGATQRVRAEAGQVVAKQQEELRSKTTTELEQYGTKSVEPAPKLQRNNVQRHERGQLRRLRQQQVHLRNVRRGRQLPADHLLGQLARRHPSRPSVERHQRADDGRGRGQGRRSRQTTRRRRNRRSARNR